MAERVSDPQERLAEDHRRRTGQLRGWLAALVVGWLFTWLLFGVEAAQYMDYVEEWEPEFTKGRLLPFAIIHMILGLIALVPLASSKTSAWARSLASVDRARFGASSATVAMAAVAVAGLLIVMAGLVHGCDEFSVSIVDACNRARGTNASVGSTVFLTGVGSLVLAAVVRVRLDRVRRIVIGGAASVFPVVSGGSTAPDISTQLARLSDLRASGHLTEQEFGAAKQRLLAENPGRDEPGTRNPAPGQPTQQEALRDNRSNALGVLSLIIGIASIPLCLPAGILGLPSGLTAIVLGVLSIQRFRQGRASNRGLAIAGIVCGGIGTVASVALLGLSVAAR
jgi:hypothetical protein